MKILWEVEAVLFYVLAIAVGLRMAHLWRRRAPWWRKPREGRGPDRP